MSRPMLEDRPRSTASAPSRLEVADIDQNEDRRQYRSLMLQILDDLETASGAAGAARPLAEPWKHAALGFAAGAFVAAAVTAVLVARSD